MADVFLDLHGSGRQVILETHSEHLVNALRIAVRRGILAPDAVALHFFEQDSRGATVVQEIAIDPTGRLDRRPRGFFDQATQDLGELMR